MKITQEYVLSTIKEKDIKFIKLQFTDLLGKFLSVDIPASDIQKILDSEITFDGSSVTGCTTIDNADLYLSPDITTFKILHYIDNKTARFICNILDHNKKQFVSDVRYKLYKSQLQLRTLGIKQFNVGVEPEFFLLERINGKLALPEEDEYFDSNINFRVDKCKKDILSEMERLDFKIEASHHEVSPSQHEINFRFSDSLSTADNVQTFKHLVKTVSAKHGFVATFMPKPFNNINGSGMHTNCSLQNMDGINMFYDTEGVSQTCKKFISGVLTRANDIALITNPTINSYKRLVKGYEAPVYISWSKSNRSTMIRIPLASKETTRIEVRNVDPLANPYLAFLSILESGLDGIRSDIKLIESTSGNLFNTKKSYKTLPSTFEESIRLFKKSKFSKDCLGEKLYSQYLAEKEKELFKYNNTIHPYEIDKYFNS